MCLVDWLTDTIKTSKSPWTRNYGLLKYEKYRLWGNNSSARWFTPHSLRYQNSGIMRLGAVQKNRLSELTEERTERKQILDVAT